MDLLERFGATSVCERVAKDGNRITGGGVTAGLYFGLAMVAEMRDRFYAQTVQLLLEYDPHPPFNAGSPLPPLAHHAGLPWCRFVRSTRWDGGHFGTL
jgi:cyclohexyl-isocyanide hydratase